MTRGYYSRINKTYSDDLAKVLKYLIKVNPSERLTISNSLSYEGQLLEMPVMKKKMKKVKDVEVEEESILLRTIKLTKNINYLTEKLPKPNYSPLRYKSLLAHRSGMNHHSSLEKKDPYDLKLSLPPIKGGVNPRNLAKSDRNLVNKSRRKITNNEESLPKLNIKYRNNSKKYLH